MIRIKDNTELKTLGWNYSKNLSMDDYYVFVRDEEKLCIDTDKMKITYYNLDEDSLPQLSYDTLKVVVKIFEKVEKENMIWVI